MFEVRVFDGRGNLKEVISPEEVSRRYDETFYQGGQTFVRLTVKTYVCVECKINFQSRSSRGAKYCKECRKKVYKIRKRRSHLKRRSRLMNSYKEVGK